jgi:hypothetical protein
MNRDLEKQRLFVNKLYARCSHSTARPSMADKGVQVSLIFSLPRACCPKRAACCPIGEQKLFSIFNTFSRKKIFALIRICPIITDNFSNLKRLGAGNREYIF